MALERCKRTMVAIQPDGSNMDSTQGENLPLAGMYMESRKIHICLDMNTAPLVLLGFLCDDGFTITLDKKPMEIQNNGQKILRGYRNKNTVMWGFQLSATKYKDNTKAKAQNLMAQATKPELASYYNAALFSPTNTSLLKAIKQVLLKP